ncbi:hypothetical protein CEXT_453641 [Caerostris extrusa]|uniref:Uncharacterized protein n=1 Tax=Caerostris extrusa TaxID=172846 RepID=A0AAV4TFP0_CAEEX|nr:hypothetical protein CEXT_453641 [Caerostris extrusa]
MHRTPNAFSEHPRLQLVHRLKSEFFQRPKSFIIKAHSQHRDPRHLDGRMADTEMGGIMDRRQFVKSCRKGLKKKMIFGTVIRECCCGMFLHPNKQNAFHL